MEGRCRGLREVLWVRWRMLPSGIRAMEVGREANVVLGKGEVFGLGVGERGDVGVGSCVRDVLECGVVCRGLFRTRIRRLFGRFLSPRESRARTRRTRAPSLDRGAAFYDDGGRCMSLRRRTTRLRKFSAISRRRLLLLSRRCDF